MIISPFTPLFFIPSYRSDGAESPFTQFFCTGDTVFMQTIRTAEEETPSCSLNALDGNESLSRSITPQSSELGDGSCVDCFTITLNAEGFFSVTVGGMESEPFEVTSSPAVKERSMLIEYSPADNTSRRDVVPVIGDARVYFAWRIPGGFKSSGYEFSVDNEQFIAQSADIVELYARESVQETLTLGWSRGVPIWFGQMLNRLLTCRYVYIDGRRYARYGSSVPEKTQTMEGVDSFVFTQKLQRINNLEPVKQP